MPICNIYIYISTRGDGNNLAWDSDVIALLDTGTCQAICCRRDYVARRITVVKRQCNFVAKYHLKKKLISFSPLGIWFSNRRIEADPHHLGLFSIIPVTSQYLFTISLTPSWCSPSSRRWANLLHFIHIFHEHVYMKYIYLLYCNIYRYKEKVLNFYQIRRIAPFFRILF